MDNQITYLEYVGQQSAAKDAGVAISRYLLVMALGRESVGCIVLAAGRSTRMGANKLIADLAGRPVIAHVVDAVGEAGLPPPVVVLGNDPERVRMAFADRSVRFTTAPDHAAGMARSLAAGIAAVPADWCAAIICLGDMPLLPPKLLREMAERASDAAIIVPIFDGRRGNPVLWGRAYFSRLASLAGDVGAKALLAELPDRLTELPWGDDAIHLDVDGAADLNHVRSRLAVASSA